MRFKSEPALNQLLKNKVVATMREFDYVAPRNVIINKKWKGLIVGKFKNTPENRKYLVTISGFDSVNAWVKEAKKLSGKMPRWIYVVCLR